MNEFLEYAIACEQQGDYLNSAEHYNKALIHYPNDKDVFYFCGKFLFLQQQYDLALDLFIRCYNHKDQCIERKQEVLQQIITTYYLPNVEFYKKNYNENLAILLSYQHNFIHELPKFEELQYYLIAKNEFEGYIYDSNNQLFIGDITFGKKDTDSNLALEMNDVVLSLDEFDVEKLQQMHDQTKDPLWINNMKVPIYLIWKDSIKREVFLQMQQYTALIKQERVVIFSDFENNRELDSFLKNMRNLIPCVLSVNVRYRDAIKGVIDRISKYRNDYINNMLEEVKRVTEGYNEEYYRKLFSGNNEEIRILFYTRRFTQVVQYATRDFMKACQRLGITCEYLIEENDLQRADSIVLLESIITFKPNVIFRINYLRSDFKDIPTNILFVSWMQDPSNQSHSVQQAKEFLKYDYAIGSKVHLDVMKETGYDSSRFSIQDVPVDDTVFVEKQLSFEEKNRYSSDIALPSNYANPEDALSLLILELLKNVDFGNEEQKQNQDFLTKLCIKSYDILQFKINNGELITSTQHCEIILNEIANLLDIKLGDKLMHSVAERLFIEVCLGLHRKTTINWVIDNGFNINLWGRNWDKDYFLRPHARGVIAHGEELAKVYSASKIILASCSHYTGHFRVFEALCCGALPFLRYIPPEVDMLNFREDFIENEHFVFFYDENDLIDKLRYYLHNENDRLRIVNNGRKRVTEVATYSIAAKKFLSFIQRDFKTC